ncbi:MAG: NmrA family NAD(P)-binding protein [Bacillota bacterium]
MVFLSLQGVENNPLVPHYKIEKLIKEEKVPYTFLRPSFFMQNLSTTHKKEIKKNDEIYIPAGKGKTNFIDVRDIADVVSLVLTEKNHINKASEITGKEALSYYEVANILSEKLGREITYKDPSVLGVVGCDFSITIYELRGEDSCILYKFLT